MYLCVHLCSTLSRHVKYVEFGVFVAYKCSEYEICYV
jgi:hypothetical protein